MKYIYRKAPEPSRKLAGAVWMWDGIVDNWEQIIEKADKNIGAISNLGTELYTWEPAATADGKTNGLRQNQIFHVTDAGVRGHEISRQVHNQIAGLIDECAGAYAQFFETSFLEHEDYHILKYEGATNDHYDAHYDGGPYNKRWISAIVYLNDDYEGGELEFVHFGVKIKPKKGSLVIFPSNYAYAHIAHTVTSGTKYAIVTWLSA